MELKQLQVISSLLFICLLSADVYAEDITKSTTKEPFPIIKTAGVPPGFQFLLEKQTTAIDVFYGDVYIGTTLASYTPTTVEFHNPDEVVAGLKNLITPEQVARDLSGEIDSHAGEVCYRDTETDCGVISPKSVGIIFDEGRFRADLFINPNLLSVQQVEFNRYLPDSSSSELTSINNLSLLYSGGDSAGDVVSLGGQSLFSLRQQRVISSWFLVDVGGSAKFGMDTLYWQMDKTDYQYQAGWFDTDTRFMSFVPNLNILGGRYSTSLKARTDLNFASGTPIQLYLSSRSRINIFKEGRFLSTGFYDPGNQTLDTSSLPDGAYDIELRIVDSVGREEKITRYYVKTQRMPPPDQDLYFIEAGDIQSSTLINQFPKSLGIPLIHGGYSHRLTNEMAINLAAMTTDKELASEFGIYYLKERFDLDPKIMLSSSGDYGWSIGGYARYDEWGAYFQSRRIWGQDEYNYDHFDLVPYSIKQQSIGISRLVWEGNLQLRYAVNKRQGFDSTELLSLTYGKSFLVKSNFFYLSTELSKSDADSLVMFSVDWNLFEDNVNHSVSTSVLHRNDQVSGTSDLFRAGYSGGWFDQDLRPEDINVQWNIQGDNKNTNFNLSNDIRNSYVTSFFGVNMNEGDLGMTTNYSGHLSTVIGGEGLEWGMGGRYGAQGALLVEVNTDVDSESAYDLFINNNLYGQVYAGQKVVVTVAPYQTYNVRLSDKNSEFVSFAEKTKRVTIYPGNVKSLKWEGKSVGVLIARVVRKLPGCFDDNDPKCWDPLVFARAKNVNDFSATDGDGYIQAEVFKSAKTFSLLKKGQECRVDFSALKFEDGLAYSEEDLKCYDVDTSDPDS